MRGDFYAVKLRGGKVKLKPKRTPRMSSYLYGSQRGVLNSSLSTGERTPDMFICKETGERVRLIEETGPGEVVFENAAGDQRTVPSYVFHSTHRDMTAEELEAFNSEAPKPAAESVEVNDSE